VKMGLHRLDGLGQVGWGGPWAWRGRDRLADVDRDDVRSLPGEPDGMRTSLSPRCSGDERDLPGQSGHLGPPKCWMKLCFQDRQDASSGYACGVAIIHVQH
jgi:hypothetical protein